MEWNTSSKLLNEIYDAIGNNIWVTGSNEDIYTKEAIKKIMHFCINSKFVSKMVWENHRNNAENGGVLAISWIEDDTLYQKLFAYTDYMED